MCCLALVAVTWLTQQASNWRSTVPPTNAGRPSSSKPPAFPRAFPRFVSQPLISNAPKDWLRRSPILHTQQRQTYEQMHNIPHEDKAIIDSAPDPPYSQYGHSDVQQFIPPTRAGSDLTASSVNQFLLQNSRGLAVASVRDRLQRASCGLVLRPPPARPCAKPPRPYARLRLCQMPVCQAARTKAFEVTPTRIEQHLSNITNTQTAAAVTKPAPTPSKLGQSAPTQPCTARARFYVPEPSSALRRCRSAIR